MGHSLPMLCVALCLSLTSCGGDPPCAPEALDKAADAYRNCIAMTQHGEGGYACGHRAYETHCTSGEHAMTEPAWPRSNGALHITHNKHRTFYETVAQALERETYWRESFPDQAEIDKAIAEDSVWEIQWYPDTPVGFCIVCAATFSRALELANAGESQNEP